MKILVEVSDHIGIKAAHWATRAALKKMFANAKEAVEVPASKHALQLWLGNPDIELYAVKEDK